MIGEGQALFGAAAIRPAAALPRSCPMPPQWPTFRLACTLTLCWTRDAKPLFWFAIITPALIVGAIAERMKFSAMMLFMTAWSLLVYSPIAHWVWGPGDVKPAHTIDAELVFVGYGVSAPERGWDDFKGVDLKGKIAVFLINDPDFEAQPGDAVAGKFGGKAVQALVACLMGGAPKSDDGEADAPGKTTAS